MKIKEVIEQETDFDVLRKIIVSYKEHNGFPEPYDENKNETVKFILGHEYSKKFRIPPTNLKHIYRSIRTSGLYMTQIENNKKYWIDRSFDDPYTVYSTNFEGIKNFLNYNYHTQTYAGEIDHFQDNIVIIKDFQPQDFLIDVEKLYESIIGKKRHPKLKNEKEIWVRNTKYYNTFSKEEIAYVDMIPNFNRNFHERPKVETDKSSDCLWVNHPKNIDSFYTQLAKKRREQLYSE